MKTQLINKDMEKTPQETLQEIDYKIARLEKSKNNDSFIIKKCWQI